MTKEQKNEMDFLIVIEKWVDWIWDLEKCENEEMIKEGIDGDGKWWNWCYSEIPVMWMIRIDEMMNRERKQRNRELLLKVRIMKETGFKNPV